MPENPPATPGATPNTVPPATTPPVAPAPISSAPLPPLSAPAASQGTSLRPVYINFHGLITEASSTKFMAAIAQIIGQDAPDCLYFLFSSPGGDVNAGVAIYNYLRSIPVPRLVMHNASSIDSVANVIFHSADERLAAPHSTFHFHGVGMNLAGTNPNLNHSQSITSGGEYRRCSSRSLWLNVLMIEP